MAIVRITDVGSLGVVKDTPGHQLPPNAWTNVQNVRMRDGKVFKTKGHQVEFGEAQVDPTWLLPFKDGNSYFWLYTSDEKIYAAEGGLHFNITRGAKYTSSTISFDEDNNEINDSEADFTSEGFEEGQELIVSDSENNDGTYTISSVSETTLEVEESLTDESEGENITLKGDDNYNASDNIRWNGGVLGNLPVLNNGVDAPQAWTDVTTGTVVERLPNWPSDTTCKILRVFKNFLVALDITEDGTRYRQRVKWSHPGDGTSAPETWDETDLTKLAGENDLLETKGSIIDALPMRDMLVIYKEDTIHGMQYVGGNYVFRFFVIFEDLGLLAQDCVVNVQGRQVFITHDDIKQHDTNSVESILDKKLRKYIFDIIDEENYDRSYAVHYAETREVWFCFPTKGYIFPNLAVIWNYVDQTFSFRDLPACRFIERGVVDVDAGDWDSDDETWDSDTSDWNDLTYSEFRRQLVGASADEALYQFDQTETFDGSSFRSMVERQGLALAGEDFQGNMIADKSSYKMVTEVWPKVEVAGDVTFEVFVGFQEDVDQEITWKGPFPFDPSKDRKINCMVAGRYIALRFESDTEGTWVLHGYDLNVTKLGRY